MPEYPSGNPAPCPARNARAIAGYYVHLVQRNMIDEDVGLGYVRGFEAAAEYHETDDDPRQT